MRPNATKSSRPNAAAEPTRLRDRRPRHGRSTPAPPRRYIFTPPLTERISEESLYAVEI